MKKWKKPCNIAAVMLSVVLMITAIPGMTIDSYAEENVPTVSEGDVPTVSEGDGTEPGITAENPIGSGEPADDIKEEIPTVSDGDSVSEPELYQSKKLRVTAKNTTIYTGQKDILVAKIGYERTTSEEGVGYQVESVRLNGIVTGDVTCDTTNPEELRISVDYKATCGKYVITLLPMIPNAIKAEPAKLTINVVAGIYDISLDGPQEVCKESGKATSFQVTAKTKGYMGVAPKRPNALKWSIKYFDSATNQYEYYDGKDITVSSNGRVSLGKMLDTAKYKEIRVVCKAIDYEGNPKETSYGVSIVSGVSVSGEAVITDGNRLCFIDGDTVTGYTLDGKNLTVGTPYDHTPGSVVSSYRTSLFTYKSNSKDVKISSSGRITVLNVSGKPVTLTATSIDGKVKKSITLNLKKKEVSMDELQVKVRVGEKNWDEYIFTKDSPDRVWEYERIGNEPVVFAFCTAEGKDYYNISYRAKGGRNITASCQNRNAIMYKIYGVENSKLGTQYIAVLPAGPEVELTVNNGKETRVFTVRNKMYSDKKNTVVKGEPKLTTVTTLYSVNDEQKIKIYVGKQNAGGKITLIPDVEYLNAGYGNIRANEVFSLLSGTRSIGEDGYAILGVQSLKYKIQQLNNEASNKNWFTVPTNIKYQMVVQDKDGNIYAPTTLTIKFSNSEPKTNYKIKTSYKITKNQESKKLEYRTWDDISGYNNANESENYYYYQQITYVGNEELIQGKYVIDIKADLGKDLLHASDLVQSMQYCMDDQYQLFFAVSDEEAYRILRDANQKIIAEGKDVAKYGRDGKVSGNIYVEYRLVTKEGYTLNRTEKVSISIVIPKTDYNRLFAEFK